MSEPKPETAVDRLRRYNAAPKKLSRIKAAAEAVPWSNLFRQLEIYAPVGSELPTLLELRKEIES